jgi:hypothetical protein
MVGNGYNSGSGYYHGCRTYHNIYIEVSLREIHVVQTSSSGQIRSANVTDLELGAIPSSIPVAHAVSEESKTIEEKLEGLERVKRILTKNEYEEKKAKILADLLKRRPSH